MPPAERSNAHEDSASQQYWTTDGGVTWRDWSSAVGAQGVTYVSRDVNAVLKFNQPISLHSSQSWRSYNDSTKLTAGTMVQVYGGDFLSDKLRGSGDS